jgi:hypothetical protein
MARSIKSSLCLIALATCAPATAAAGVPATAAAAPTVTGQGVGALRLGAGVRSLHRRHLIGRLQPGCELDPGQRVARLRQPLRGFAIFHGKRLRSITISGGARTARGIGIGSTPSEARQAYPNAEYVPPGQADPFEDGFFWVNDSVHPHFTFTVDAQSLVISQINVPWPAFCE